MNNRRVISDIYQIAMLFARDIFAYAKAQFGPRRLAVVLLECAVMLIDLTATMERRQRRTPWQKDGTICSLVPSIFLTIRGKAAAHRRSRQSP